MSGPRLLLVGAGHAHLHAIAHATGIVRRGIEITLVSPRPFVYSAYIAARLGGRIVPGAGRIDTHAAVQAAGGASIRGAVERIDAARRIAVLDDGSELPWDAISLDVGSRVPRGRIPGAAGVAFRVKPYSEMRALDERLEERLRCAQPIRVVVMGGGASAVELAGNLEWRLRGRGRIHVITAGSRLIEDMSASAGRRVERHLRGRGVVVDVGRAIERVHRGRVFDARGGSEAFDVLVDATGLEPYDLAGRSGLPHVRGAMLVDEHLRSVADERIFGGGDAVRLRGFEHVRPAGVHAVQQAPVLLRNLIAMLEGSALRTWGPPAERYLAILDLGAGQAMAVRGRWHWLGPAARRLKDAIDAHFVRRHR